MTPLQILRDLGEAARNWRNTKNTFLAAKRSGAATEEVVRLQKVHLRAVADLDKATLAFEQLPAVLQRLAKKKKINWKLVIDGVAAAATAVSKATNPAPTSFVDLARGTPFDPSKVIDVKE